MSTRVPRDEVDQDADAPLSRTVALQCVASSVGTLIGAELGPSLGGKLVTGVLGALIGAFLTAPGSRHPRRIVAAALLVAIVYARKATDAMAGSRRPDWAPGQLVAGSGDGGGRICRRGGDHDSARWVGGGSGAVVERPD
jgi:hypothetical protein